MNWQEVIIAAHVAVTECVSHASRMQSERYFVWQEDGNNDLQADNGHIAMTVCGTTDLFTKIEFDPWKGEFEKSLDGLEIFWFLKSIQHEENTGFWHYEWRWEVPT